MKPKKDPYASQKAYYIRNREKRLVWQRAYHETHREANLERMRNYYHEQKKLMNKKTLKQLEKAMPVIVPFIDPNAMAVFIDTMFNGDRAKIYEWLESILQDEDADFSHAYTHFLNIAKSAWNRERIDKTDVWVKANIR